MALKSDYFLSISEEIMYKGSHSHVISKEGKPTPLSQI